MPFSLPQAAAPPNPARPRSEKIIWILFAATSIQLVFLQPFIILVPGERTNLFSGLLCFLALVAALALGRRDAIRIKSPEVIISLALAIMAGISPWFSLTPLPSAFRVFVLLASGLGGFWCARVLLRQPENQRLFLWLALALLAGLLGVCLGGYLLSGQIDRFIHSHTHPLTDTIFLLSFAPLALLGQKSRRLVALGVALLVLSYLTLCVSGRVTVIFIPLVLCLLAVLMRKLRLKQVILIVAGMAVAVGLFHQHVQWWKISREYPFYRIENFPFSWSIAKQHPLWGIGLRSPREQFLENYQITYPYTSKEEFAPWVKGITSADNIFLTFMAGLGLPFTLTYAGVLIILMFKLIRMASRPPPGLVFSPAALLFPLTLALVHFQLYDGLLFAQNSWFFHILLGLIPVGATALESEAAISGVHRATKAQPELTLISRERLGV